LVGSFSLEPQHQPQPQPQPQGFAQDNCELEKQIMRLIVVVNYDHDHIT
jgi:hypothetical protein